MSAPRLWTMTMLVLAGALGCDSPTGSCVPPRQVAGVWQYTATQDAPLHASFSGTLVISREACDGFEGTLDVVRRIGTESLRLAGPLSGVLLDSTVARIDATLGGTVRQHVARFGKDSVAGSWVEFGASSAATGHFVAYRQD